VKVPSPGRTWIERIDVEQTVGRGIRDVSIADTRRALKRTAIGKIQVSRIEARARARRQIRASFAQIYGAYGPPGPSKPLAQQVLRHEGRLENNVPFILEFSARFGLLTLPACVESIDGRCAET